jgi:hypothetical protein
VRVYVIDVVGRQPGIRQCIADAADDRFAIRTGTRAVEGVRHLAGAFHHAQNPGAARLRRLQAFQHQSAGALGHDKAVAVFGERLGGALRRIIRRRQRGKQREAHQRLRVD